MTDLSDYAEVQAFKWMFTADAVTRPTAWYIALYTVAPTDAGGGTEVSGNGYARQSVTFTETGGVGYSDAQEQFEASGGDFGTIRAVGIFDASTGGNLLAWKAITAQSVVNGQQATFAAGAITGRFD